MLQWGPLRRCPTRLYRRGATYCHRAVVPKDIIARSGKREETFSLGTKDHAEAVRRVRVAAVEVDRRFDHHRRRLKQAEEPPLAELTPQQIAGAKAAYLHHLLEEDEEVRLDGFYDPMSGEPVPYAPRPTFEEREEVVEDMDAVTRARRRLLRSRRCRSMLNPDRRIPVKPGPDRGERSALALPTYDRGARLLPETT